MLCKTNFASSAVTHVTASLTKEKKMGEILHCGSAGDCISFGNTCCSIANYICCPISKVSILLFFTSPLILFFFFSPLKKERCYRMH